MYASHNGGGAFVVHKLNGINVHFMMHADELHSTIASTPVNCQWCQP